MTIRPAPAPHGNQCEMTFFILSGACDLWLTWSFWPPGLLERKNSDKAESFFPLNFKGAVSRNSVKLGYCKMPVKLNET